MKKIALITLIVCMLFLLSGCNLIGHDVELDNAQTVATVNGDKITKGDWLNYRNYLAAYEQSMYRYYGMNVNVDPATYGDRALEDLVQSKVLEDKMDELKVTPLTDEENKEIEEYADNMMKVYKSMVRYSNHPDVETVEEEAERLAAEAEKAEAEKSEAAETEQPNEAEAAETEAAAEETTEGAEPTAEEAEAPAETSETEPEKPKATMTNAELDALLETEVAETYGYNREYFVSSRTSSKKDEKLRAIIYEDEDIKVDDKDVESEFKDRTAQQKATYDQTPTRYASDVRSNNPIYYIPEGYRGIKHILIQISTENQDKIKALESEMDEIQDAIDEAQNAINAFNEEKESENADAADHTEEIAGYQSTIDEKTAELTAKQAELDTLKESAFAEIKEAADAALQRAQAGEDFDALVEELGQDPGMKNEPDKSRGYLVCEGLTLYETPFQEAAMALEKAGDISSELVKTNYGYHVLQYAGDIASGEQELTEEIKTSISDDLLKNKQDAAYEAAVTKWVSEADVKTFPKIMK